jgi:hypothetical protein
MRERVPFTARKVDQDEGSFTNRLLRALGQTIGRICIGCGDLDEDRSMTARGSCICICRSSDTSIAPSVKSLSNIGVGGDGDLAQVLDKDTVATSLTNGKTDGARIQKICQDLTIDLEIRHRDDTATRIRFSCSEKLIKDPERGSWVRRMDRVSGPGDDSFRRRSPVAHHGESFPTTRWSISEDSCCKSF